MQINWTTSQWRYPVHWFCNLTMDDKLVYLWIIVERSHSRFFQTGLEYDLLDLLFQIAFAIQFPLCFNRFDQIYWAPRPSFTTNSENSLKFFGLVSQRLNAYSLSFWWLIFLCKPWLTPPKISDYIVYAFTENNLYFKILM